jgi:hypothetical protein
MGETAMRLRRVKERRLSGEKRSILCWDAEVERAVALSKYDVITVSTYVFGVTRVDRIAEARA